MTHNTVTLVEGIKTIFRINWGIEIDSHEIDMKLSFRENFVELYNKKITGQCWDLEELV